ncbi:MAG: glycosyltransferase, partial [Euryarchaeota archaeon]|nr:glycosyltransferase [Euryarchaeota archaeon]
LQDTVRFMGYTAQPEIAYNMGDVVAMPSISEGFPYALLEAMAIGKPIVATDVGGVREALNHGGIIVPPRSPRLFADAIVTLLRDPPLRDLLGRLARDRATSLYSISTFLDQYRAVYGRFAA